MKLREIWDVDTTQNHDYDRLLGHVALGRIKKIKYWGHIYEVMIESDTGIVKLVPEEKNLHVASSNEETTGIIGASQKEIEHQYAIHMAQRIAARRKREILDPNESWKVFWNGKEGTKITEMIDTNKLAGKGAAFRVYSFFGKLYPKRNKILHVTSPGDEIPATECTRKALTETLGVDSNFATKWDQYILDWKRKMAIELYGWAWEDIMAGGNPWDWNCVTQHIHRIQKTEAGASEVRSILEKLSE